jgi:hypothetical protein
MKQTCPSRTPTLWLLYLLVGVLVGHLALIESLVVVAVVRVSLECVVVVASFGLMTIWVRRYRAARDLER